jgi:non-specific serine/threonine protein kinase
LDLLTQLVDKSLVVVERGPGQVARYRLLETIRHYAHERLHEAGETGVVLARHRDWYMSLAERSEPELKGPRQGEWLERLGREHDNLRAALAWSLENDAPAALRLVGTLGRFWFMRGHLYNEGIEWLERVLSRTEASEHAAARARATSWLGRLTLFQGDFAATRSAYEQSLTLYEQLGDKDGIADSLSFLADIAASQARTLYARARSSFEESLADLRRQGDQWTIAVSLTSLGEIARVEGDYLAARSFYEESLAIQRELGDQRGMAVSLINLGLVAHNQCDYRQATAFFKGSLALFQKHGGKRGCVDCLAALAGVAGAERQPERAARLLGAAEALRQANRIGPAMNHADRLAHDRFVAAARVQLDVAAFAAWAEGREMTMEQAIAYALLEAEAPRTVQAAKDRYGGLTAREREIAALIARGKSNREIAEAMVVGVRTIETYVTRILNKLGFDSRVQIATWAVEKKLTKPEHSE